ncbi:hypothetical protein KAX14_00475, partial [Candidatus Bipolaricaulota bacterium]|nr:hypothetical protein [Candidatus Bipolaricaulota bacterium]
MNGKTKTEATRNHAQVLISKLLPQRAHFMCDVLFNSKEKRYYLTAKVAEFAEETGKGSKTKTPYCQRQRHLTAGNAKESKNRVLLV